MPPSQCGVWPAFWAYGSSWPDGGELDIIEGANDAHNNIISGHTSNGCSQDPPDAAFFTGEQRNDACAVDSNNIGCGFNPPETDVSSYGDGFNAMKGGVYAMLWDSDFIKIWHFARDSIPQDIGLKAPNPATWGLPQARFGGQACDVDSHWKNMSLVINTVSSSSHIQASDVRLLTPYRTFVAIMEMQSGVKVLAASMHPRAQSMLLTTLMPLPMCKSPPPVRFEPGRRQLLTLRIVTGISATSMSMLKETLLIPAA